MNKIRALKHRILASVCYYAEQWKLVSNKYPRRILLKKLDPDGIWFKVDNITEANRVCLLDDEEDFLNRVLLELRSDDIFFDVGACVGLFSLHAAKRTKQVFAFEHDITVVSYGSHMWRCGGRSWLYVKINRSQTP